MSDFDKWFPNAIKIGDIDKDSFIAYLPDEDCYVLKTIATGNGKEWADFAFKPGRDHFKRYPEQWKLIEEYEKSRIAKE
jgi:hypothetical protein